MKNILVTGGNGQLAHCIKDLDSNIEGYNFIYKDLPEFDITNLDLVITFFKETKIDYCINCAAYTAVDKAESDQETAHKVNVTGVQNLVLGCEINNTKAIHISTDFVFSGNKTELYKESDNADPISVYGSTKLAGEKALIDSKIKYFILRTSWLYSEHGHNFMKTMIRLGNEREDLGVVHDQIGTPTYAKDLVEVVFDIIKNNNDNYGLYHYSNEGVASWYDFANEIFKQEKIQVNLKPIPSEDFLTPAERPKNSVLDKSKIRTQLNIEIPHWKDSLKQALSAYHKL